MVRSPVAKSGYRTRLKKRRVADANTNGDPSPRETLRKDRAYRARGLALTSLRQCSRSESASDRRWAGNALDAVGHIVVGDRAAAIT